MADALDDPETIKMDYGSIQEAVQFHRAWVDRIADSIVWSNVAFTKEGGKEVLEKMIELEPNKADEHRKTLEYWKVNYDSIREHVYQVEKTT